MPRVYLPSEHFGASPVALPSDVLHYLQIVLRLGPGDEFTGFDGLGGEYLLRLVLTTTGLAAEVVEHLPPRIGLQVRLTLYQGLPKGKRLPLIIQKTTELGLAELVPVQTARSVVRIEPAEAEGKARRWQKIAAEAAEQSLRGAPPNIRPPLRWTEALASWQQTGEPGLLLDETLAGEPGQGLRRALETIGYPPALAVFVGPEGGFSPEEGQAARAAGLQPVSLGSRVLRTETAAIVVCALVVYEYGELG